ncbi:MAG: hypothetical protein ACOC0P_01850 [Planctomycetota bacterium]
MRFLTSLAVAALATPAFAQTDVYVGSRITNPVDCAEFCCLETFDPLQNYQEAGLTIDVDDFHFDFTPCGLTSEEMYYPNGGVLERISITRTDGADFGRVEMQVSHGFGGCDIFVWVTPMLDGSSLGDFPLDVSGGDTIGIEGLFDEVMIGAYADATTRDQFVETNSNAIAIDNVCYEDGESGPSLSFSGNCPGTGNFEVSGATPNGNVALVYGFGSGPTTVPSGFPCAGTVLDVGNPNLDFVTFAVDANGNGTFQAFLPAIACGAVNVQALDLTSCAVSNVVAP